MISSFCHLLINVLFVMSYMRVRYSCYAKLLKNALLKDLGLLKVCDIFKLRLLKFYYKLMNNELPSYFMTYVPIITKEAYILNHDYALRTGARPAIRTPRIHHLQGRIGNEKVICHVLGLGAPYRKFQSQLQ